MPVPLQVSRFKVHIVLYGLFFLVSVFASFTEQPLMLDIGSLACSAILGIVSLIILKSAVSFQRFLCWLVSFVWCDFFSSLSILIIRDNYFVLPDWLNKIIYLIDIAPTFLLLFTCFEVIYLIRERLDFRFFLINLVEFFAFFSVTLYGIMIFLIPYGVLIMDNIFVLINVASIILIISLVTSVPKGQLHQSLIITLVGIVLYNIIDSGYVVFPMLGLGDSPQFLMFWWIIYFLPPLAVTLALFALVKHSGYLTTYSVREKDANLTSFSFRRGNIQYVLFALTLIAFLFHIIGISLFLLATLILLMHLLISNFYQISVQNRQYIQKQKTLHDELKEEVTQRNIELLKQNIKLQEVVNRDFLTNAYNRRYLQELLAGLNEDARLFAIDILQFSNINQVFGESVGDQVLIHLYNTLQQAFPTQLIFRVDSNEYVILFRGAIHDINEISRKIFDVVAIPFISGFYKISLDVGVGVSTYSTSDSEDKPDNLLAKVNFALNEVKASVIQPRILVYDQRLADKKYRYGLIQSLLDSINYDDEFRLFFQPQYTADGNTLIGMEALLRWTSPTLGSVSPAEFIPIAEETSTIINIVGWTLKKACLQVKEWNSKYGLQLKVGVNLSPKFVEKPDFYEDLQKMVLAYGLNVNWLDLEITETSVMHLDLSVIELFKKLSNFGISTSIDDFGTGYSSLSYIKNLKISTLKIAKELVDSLSQDSNDALIVNAIIKMAQGLNIKTIAEGVETREQLATLRSLGCDYIQGYYFGKPLPPEEFVKMHL